MTIIWYCMEFHTIILIIVDDGKLYASPCTQYGTLWQ